MLIARKETTMSYLVKSSSGCYYFRIRVPKPFQHLYKNRVEIKKSLHTKDAIEASYLASKLSFQLKKFWSAQMSDKLATQFIIRTTINTDGSITQEASTEPDKDQSQELQALETYIKHTKKQLKTSDSSSPQTLNPVRTGTSKTTQHQYTKQLLSAAISQYISEKKTKKSWAPATHDAYTSAYQKALDFLTDKPLDSYTREDASSYLEHLQSLKLATKTINFHITALASLFKHFIIHYDLPKNPFTDFQLKETERPDQQKAIYTDSELKTLFENLTFDPKKPSRYWIPLIMLFSGMRPAEIAQLQKSNIVQIENIWCFDIKNMRVKTKNSIRKVPIHQKLIDLGFLDYVNSIKTTRLFNELNPDRSKAAGAVSTFWNDHFHNKFGLDITKKSLYSLRHNFATQLRNNNIPETFAAEILGHEKGKTMSYGLYGAPLSAAPDQVQKFHEIINTIKYDDISFNSWPS